MNSTTIKQAKVLATAAVGIAVAAGSLAFTFDQGMPSGHDSFGTLSASTSVSDHDSLRSTANAGGASASVAASSGTTSSHLDEATRRLEVAQASSASSAAGSTGSEGRRLDLGLRVQDLSSDCTRIAVMDLSARDAVDCGLDASDWALANVATTWQQTRGNVEVVVSEVRDIADQALDTADRAVEQVKDTADRAVDRASDTVETVRDLAQDTVSSTVGTTKCVIGQPVMDASVSSIVSCA